MRKYFSLPLQGIDNNSNQLIKSPNTLKDCQNMVFKKKGEISSRAGSELLVAFQKVIIDSINNEDSSSYKYNVRFSNNVVRRVASFDGNLFFHVDGRWQRLSVSQKDGLAVQSIETEKGDVLGQNLAVGNDFYYYLDGQMKKIVSFDGNYFVYSCTLPVAYKPNLKALKKISNPEDDFQSEENPNQYERVGLLKKGESVAYRICYKRTFINGKVQRSAPSSRLVISLDDAHDMDENDEFNVELSFNFPEDLHETDEVEIYSSHSITESPDDDLLLVATFKVSDFSQNSQKEKLNGGVFLHSLKDKEGQFFLYTSTNQEGIQNQNDPIPHAESLSLYRNMLTFSDIKQVPEQLIEMKPSRKIQSGDQIILSTDDKSITIFASHSEGEDSFLLTNNQKENISNLVTKINTHHENDFVHAYDLSDLDNTAFLLRSKNFSVKKFTIRFFQIAKSQKTAEETDVFYPNLSHGWVVNQKHYKNRIAFSKPFVYEHVPYHRFLEIGAMEKKIFAVFEKMGYLYVFKEDGLFRVFGNSIEDFSIDLIDPDLVVFDKQGLLQVGNVIYAFCTQGIAKISFDGFQIISESIHQELTKRLQWSNRKNCKLIYHKTHQQIIFHGFSSEELVDPDEAWVFHLRFGEWTKWSHEYTYVLDRDFTSHLIQVSGHRVYREHLSSNPKRYHDKLKKMVCFNTSLISLLKKSNALTNGQRPTKLDLSSLQKDHQNGYDYLFCYSSVELQNGKISFSDDDVRGLVLIEKKNKRNEELYIVDNWDTDWDQAENGQFPFVDNRKLSLIGGVSAKNLSLLQSFIYETNLENSSEKVNIEFDLSVFENTDYQFSVYQFEKPIKSEIFYKAMVASKHGIQIASTFARSVVFQENYLSQTNLEKDFHRFSLYFSHRPAENLDVSIKTSELQKITLPIGPNESRGGYGEGRFGIQPYGGRYSLDESVTISFPRQMKHGRSMTLGLFNRGMGSDFKLRGYTLEYAHRKTR